jgi:hypothetical protein
MSALLAFQNPAPGAAPVARQAPTATEMYDAARLQQRALRSQLDQLQSERRQVHSQLRDARNTADVKGLESQLVAIDASIVELRKQVTASDALVANRAGIPGVVVETPVRVNNDMPPGVMVVSGLSMLMIVMLPMSIALARRVWLQAPKARPTALPTDLGDRLSNMERGIEAVALEVERIGEGQRFVTQLLSESDKRRQLQALTADLGRDVGR